MNKVIYLYYRIGRDLNQLRILENEYGMFFRQTSKDNIDVLIDEEGNCFVMPIKMGDEPPRWFTICKLQHKTFKSIELNNISPNYFEVIDIGQIDLGNPMEIENVGNFKERTSHIWRSNVTDNSYQEMYIENFFSSTANDFQNQFNKYFGIIGRE